MTTCNFVGCGCAWFWAACACVCGARCLFGLLRGLDIVVLDGFGGFLGCGDLLWLV